MTTSTKFIIAITLVVIVGGGVFWLVGNQSEDGSFNLGGVTNYDAVETAVLAVGSGCDNEGSTCVGTTHTKFLSGTCNASQKVAGSHAATTSMQFYCAVSNVTSGDKVFVTLPVGAGLNNDGAGSLAGGFELASAYATSTGFIGFTVLNMTGAATSSYPQATTSVAYWVVDN